MEHFDAAGQLAREIDQIMADLIMFDEDSDALMRWLCPPELVDRKLSEVLRRARREKTAFDAWLAAGNAALAADLDRAYPPERGEERLREVKRRAGMDQ